MCVYPAPAQEHVGCGLGDVPGLAMVTRAHWMMLKLKSVSCFFSMRWSPSSTGAVPGQPAHTDPSPAVPVPTIIYLPGQMTVAAARGGFPPETDVFLRSKLVHSNVISA